MGCGQSRLDNEESVARCKERRNLMKEAVSVRNAFASVHSAYAMALKNTGAALNDYAQGEAPSTEPPLVVNKPSSEPPPPMMERSPLPPPPPPPLPNFSPMPPLQRAMTMPELSKPPEKTPTEAALPPPPPPEGKGAAWDYFFMVENMAGGSLEEVEEEEDDDEESEKDNGGVEELKGMEQTPAKEKQFIMHSDTAAAAPEIRKAGNSEDFFKVLGEIDDHFLKASECAQEVSTMLEATRLHYHSNFAHNPGHIDHAARVMRVITWNKSFKGGVPNGNVDATKDDELGSDEYETHASVLDKLLAWEKKLYEEVKAGELIKHEYQKKVRLLNKLKKGNNNATSSEALEKTKAGVSHLHTRYIVDMQSLDSTLTEVNTIRDNQLYPKLVDLVHGMGRMWESMCTHHENQLTIATHLKSIDISITTPIETSKHHLEHTIQLAKVVADWGQQFENLVNNQKSYIQALNAWLKLNLIPIESSLKDKPTSPPPPPPPPPIQPLLQAWHELLEKLPDELAKSAIASFEAVIRTIIVHQEEEVRLKEKCEETRKEYVRKRQAFEEWYQKYTAKAAAIETTNPKDPIAEKQFVVVSLKKRLEDETVAHQKQCIQVREKSLGNLKVRLPELFHSITDYSHACLDAYQRLGLLVVQQSQNRPA